jgi:tight adherence protein B
MNPAVVLSGIVFAGTAGVIIGAYWALVLRGEQKVLQRIKPQKKQRGPGQRLDMLKPDETMSSVGTIDRMLRTSGMTGRVQGLLDQAGGPMTVSVFLLAIACAALVVFLVAFHFSQMLTASVALALVGGSIPVMIVRRRRRKRIDKFEEQFPEAVDLIARALRAGHGLQTGVGMVADELSAPVGTEFRILFDEQNFGLSLNDAMRNFARRVPVLDARFFVTAVLTQRETGGNLAEVLDNLGNVIRERFKIKRQVRVLSAHGRTTGWVLALLPPALAAATLVVNPHHLGSLVSDPLGQKMIMAGLVMQVAGTLIIRKIVNVEY